MFNSVVFAKFTIDTVGNIKNISLTNLDAIPQVFKTVATNVILATTGKWTPRKINNKAIESRPFVLPFIYAMEAGCNPQDVQINNTYKPVSNSLETSLLFILNFKDSAGNKITQLDCTLLSPLYAFSQN